MPQLGIEVSFTAPFGPSTISKTATNVPFYWTPAVQAPLLLLSCCGNIIRFWLTTARSSQRGANVCLVDYRTQCRTVQHLFAPRYCCTWSDVEVVHINRHDKTNSKTHDSFVKDLSTKWPYQIVTPIYPHRNSARGQTYSKTRKLKMVTVFRQNEKEISCRS